MSLVIKNVISRIEKYLIFSQHSDFNSNHDIMELLIYILSHNVESNAFKYLAIQRDSIDFILHASQVVINPVGLAINRRFINRFITSN